MITAVLLTIVISAITYYIYRAKNYWTRRGVPTYGNILTGCFTKTFRAQENLAVGLENLYHRTKHERYVGTHILGQPILVLNDPEIIKEVFLTEYASFASHGMVPSSKTDTVSAHLFVLEGAQWKFIRSKMSPSFSSGKLKSMLPIIVEKVRHCERKMSEQGSTTVVYNAWMRKLSIDVIFACFMGIEANCLDSTSSQFLDVSYMLNTPTYGQFANTILYFNFRKLSDIFMRMGVTNFLPGFADKFLSDLSNQFIKQRSQGGEKRNDFMDTMVQLWRESENGAKEKVTEGTIAAQIFVMFAAGFETTSQANTYMLFEMARQPQIMRKVQEECDHLLKETGGEITHELLAKMEYTDKVIKETLRIYPALHFLTRSNIKACKLPLTDLELEKDTSIWISLRGIHRDPDYFPEPDKFDPERFSKENIQSIPSNVFMPFGDGPRTCIGMRFAMMSIKTTVLTILSKYDIRLTEATPKTVGFEPLVYFPVPSQDCPLELVPRNT